MSTAGEERRSLYVERLHGLAESYGCWIGGRARGDETNWLRFCPFPRAARAVVATLLEKLWRGKAEPVRSESEKELK